MNPFTMQRHPSMYRFLLPNEIWPWNLKPAAFVILAYRPAGRSTACLLSGSWLCVPK